MEIWQVLGGPGDTLLMATRNPSKNSPVEGKVVEIPNFLHVFFVHPGWCRISEPSTVLLWISSFMK